MEIYCTKATCRVCGCITIKSKFKPKVVLKDEKVKDGSYVRRTCERCGCHWREIPLYRVKVKAEGL